MDKLRSPVLDAGSSLADEGSLISTADRGGNNYPGTGSQVVASGPHAQNAEKWERHLKAKRKWVAANKAEIAAYQKQYTKDWRERNKDKVRATRREHKHGAKATTLLGLLASQGGRCKLCGADLSAERHLDHILPKSRGGKSEISNYQYLCPPCNQGKGVSTNEEYLEHIRTILLFNGKWWE